MQAKLPASERRDICFVERATLDQNASSYFDGSPADVEHSRCKNYVLIDDAAEQVSSIRLIFRG